MTQSEDKANTSLPNGDFFVYPIPPYLSQFASRSFISEYIDDRSKALEDPRWKNFGFATKEDYAFWVFRLCGLVSVKMVLHAFSDDATRETIKELTDKGIALGGYKTHDEDGNFIDMGWFYGPLIELAKEYGLSGEVYRQLSVDEICQNVLDNKYTIVSVTSGVIRSDFDYSEKKGGHLVLVVGLRMKDAKCEGFYIHNPSGRIKETQEKAFIPMERFLNAFASRGFSLYKKKSI